MKPSDCRKARKLMHDYVDGQLSARAAGFVEGHAGQCAACQSDLAAYRTMKSELSQLPRLSPSPAFTEVVMEQLSREAGRPPLIRLALSAFTWLGQTPRRLVLASAASTAVAVLAIMSFIHMSMPEQGALGPSLTGLQQQVMLQGEAQEKGKLERTGDAGRGGSNVAAEPPAPGAPAPGAPSASHSEIDRFIGYIDGAEPPSKRRSDALTGRAREERPASPAAAADLNLPPSEQDRGGSLSVSGGQPVPKPDVVSRSLPSGQPGDGLSSSITKRDAAKDARVLTETEPVSGETAGEARAKTSAGPPKPMAPRRELKTAGEAAGMRPQAADVEGLPYADITPLATPLPERFTVPIAFVAELTVAADGTVTGVTFPERQGKPGETVAAAIRAWTFPRQSESYRVRFAIRHDVQSGWHISPAGTATGD